MMSHVLQMKQAKHRKVELLAQGHTASQWLKKDSNAGRLVSVHTATTLC